MIPTLQPPVIEVKDSDQTKKWIGSATMQEDGTIRVSIRMEYHGSAGEALTIYKPNDPKYMRILNHLPGLKPGVFVSVYDDWD